MTNYGKLHTHIIETAKLYIQASQCPFFPIKKKGTLVDVLIILLYQPQEWPKATGK